MSRELLQKVLDALGTCKNNRGGWDVPEKTFDEDDVCDAIKALTAALAQPEPSPVAWMEEHGHMISAAVKMGVAGNCSSQDAQHYTFPLYAAPPAPEARTCAFPVESGSKPVAWLMTTPELGNRIYIDDPVEAARFAGMDNRTVTPLYMAPPAPYAVTYRNPADDAALKRSFEAMESWIVAELRKELADMTAQRDSWIALMDIARDVYDTTAAKALADMNTADIDADRLDAHRWRFFLTAQDETTPEHAAIVSAANGLFPVSDLSKVMEIAMTGGQP
jgi:hypothetical protein